MQILDCEECGMPAEVVDTFVLESTSGNVTHEKVRCIQQHWYYMFD